MSTRDLVLVSTFVNALILGFLVVLSKGEEEPKKLPLIEKQVVTVATVTPSSPVVFEPIVTAEPVPPPPPPPPAEEWYTMKSGDNPWKVAKTQKIKFDDLLKINGLNEERARNLKPGDQIRIR